MNTWRLSEKDTAALRETVYCPPDACVYRSEHGLLAVMYVQVLRNGTMWHLYISGAHGRMPAIEDLLDARATLLPGIEDWQIEAPTPGMGNVVHMMEVPEEMVYATRQ